MLVFDVGTFGIEHVEMSKGHLFSCGYPGNAIA